MTVIASDKSARSVDKFGRMRVSMTRIMKEQVSPYYGHEIPGWRSIGLVPDRIYKLYRPAEEIEKAAKTFEGIPVMNVDVHREAQTALDPKREYIEGSTGTGAVFERPYLSVPMSFWVSDAIDDVESGERVELSAAYTYRADMTPGEFEGERYDGVMRDIEGNHVAPVEDGRAGPDIFVADEALASDAEWSEEDHPRDKDGKFDSGSSSDEKNGSKIKTSFYKAEGKTREDVRNEIRGDSEKLKSELEKMGAKVSLDHSGSAFGTSSYLTIFDPETGRKIQDVRMSDHMKGNLENSQSVLNVSGQKGIDEIVELFKSIREKGPIAGWETPKEKEIQYREKERKKREKFLTFLKEAKELQKKGEPLKADHRYALRLEEEGKLVDEKPPDLAGNGKTATASDGGFFISKGEKTMEKKPSSKQAAPVSKRLKTLLENSGVLASDASPEAIDDVVKLLEMEKADSEQPAEEDVAVKESIVSDNPDSPSPPVAEPDKSSGEYVLRGEVDKIVQAAVAKALMANDELHEAKRDTEDEIGEMASDSASDIYKKALESRGVDIEGVHPSAYRALYRAMPKTIVSDSKPKEKKPLPTDRIKKL